MTLEVDVRARRGELDLAVRLAVGDEPLVLAGPNGAGKSTLLALLLGVLSPEAGRVALDGAVLFDAARRVRVAPEDRRIGYVPQHYALFPHLTALGNVEFALACQRRPLERRAREARARELLAALGVDALAERRAASLSGGEQQRVALARAVAIEPRALLLDEPLSALDAASRRRTRAWLAVHLAELKLPTIVVTHDPADAVALAGRVAVLERGRLVQLGAWQEIARRPASPYVEELVAAAATPAPP